MKRTGFIAAVIICLMVAWSAYGGDLSPREVYTYLWKAKLSPGIEPKPEDLANVAYWWETLKVEVRDRIVNTIQNQALSEREKKRKISDEIPGTVYGAMATEKGEEISGVIKFRNYRETPDGEPGINVSQEGKGSTVIPYASISLLEVLDDSLNLMIRRVDGQLTPGKASGWELLECSVFNRRLGTVSSSHASKKKIALGGIQTVLCPACFRAMETDWRFCPYCGAQLWTPGKSKETISDHAPSRE